jgi:7,8-dihydropterin-6-yl-methyl-4-(beta-D-ribofuranosyl)aminobenzene 5'-phosphate synthase
VELSRRSLLALAGASLIPVAPLRAIDALAVPLVERLELTVLIDSTTGVFGVPISRPGIQVIPPPITSDYHTAFAGQWGYSMLAAAAVGGKRRITLIDFGYTPAALLNNMKLLGVVSETIDAMVLSHGHYDHFGGLDGFLASGRVRSGTPLFVGGEEAFCARIRGTDPDGASFGAIDRPSIRKAGLDLVVSGVPRIVAGSGFTTGTIPFVSAEHPHVPTAMLPGQNCDRSLLDPSKRDKSFVVDDAEHELGTAFNVAGRGLVVIGSCSHRGIINTVLRAQAVSGIEKVHAIVGGFHLIPPQSREQAMTTLSMMQALNPDYVIPGHCTGETFVSAAIAAMPEKVIRSVVGTRYIFDAA